MAAAAYICRLLTELRLYSDVQPHITSFIFVITRQSRAAGFKPSYIKVNRVASIISVSTF